MGPGAMAARGLVVVNQVFHKYAIEGIGKRPISSSLKFCNLLLINDITSHSPAP